MASKLDLPPGPVRDMPEADVSPNRGPRFPKDALARRFGWACLVSALVNVFLWWQASGFVRRHLAAPPQTIEIQRIILPRIAPKKPKPTRKIMPLKPIIKPRPKPIMKPKPVIKPRPVVKPKTVVRTNPLVKPPLPAHNRVLVSKGPGPVTHTALSGGHAALGKPMEHQNVGEGRDNNQPPTPSPPKPEPQPAPKPEPPPTPKPAGPTQDATFDPGPSPEIPDDLKSESFKSFVRVRVNVQADGSFTPVLRTSSGNADIDRLVLDSLKRHGRAKPALQNGTPVESAFLFKYEFEVQ